MFTCNRCNYNTSDRSNFIRHLKKINICNAIDEEHLLFNPDDQLKELINYKKTFSCVCKKLYTSSRTLAHHKKNCKYFINKNIDIIQQITVLKEEVKQLKENQQKPIIINNDNRTFIINTFGQEGIDYITNEIYNKYLANPETAIKRLTQEIHLNDEHPENQNVKITDQSRNIIKTYKLNDDNNNGKWIKSDKKVIIMKIIDTMKHLFKKFMDKNNGLNNWGDGEQYNNDIYEYIFSANKELNKAINKEFNLQLKKEIELLLSNI